MNTTTTSMARRIAARRTIAASLLGAVLLVGAAAPVHADEDVTCTLKRPLMISANSPVRRKVQLVPAAAGRASGRARRARGTVMHIRMSAETGRAATPFAAGWIPIAAVTE